MLDDTQRGDTRVTKGSPWMFLSHINPIDTHHLLSDVLLGYHNQDSCGHWDGSYCDPRIQVPVAMSGL